MFDNSKISDSTPMKPELRKENCEFISMRKVKDDKTGQISVILSFVDPTKATVALREFMPKRIVNTAKPQTDEEYRKSVSLSVSRLAHVFRAFMTEEEFQAIKTSRDPNSLVQANIEANWEEYLRLNAAKLQVQTDGSVVRAKGIKCALKVVYNETKGKYYSGLPKVPPFISTEAHPKQFTINPQYDIFEIPSLNKPDLERGTNGQTQVEDAGFSTAPSTTPTKTEHESGF